MSAKSVLLAFVGACACLLGCGHQRPATAEPSTQAPVAMSPATMSSALGLPATAQPPQPRSEFWVMAEGWEGTPEYSNFLRLCVIGDVVAICGEHLVEKAGSFVKDESDLASGIFYDAPVAGRLPDDVWTTQVVGADGGCGIVALSRFTDRAWKTVDKFTECWEYAYRDYRMSPWWPGRLLVMFAPFCCEDDRMEFYSFGDGPKKVLPRAKRDGGRRILSAVGDMKAFADGTVVASGRTVGLKPVLEVWRNPANGSDVVPVPCGDGIAAAVSLGDLVLFGDSDSGAPCATRRAGSSWIDLQVPTRLAPNSNGRGSVASYSREPGGTEWAVVFDAGTSVLISRRPGLDWARVALPPPRHSDAGPVELQPLQVHAAADGDVWVRAHYKAEYDRGVILRNRKPTQVAWQGRKRATVEKVQFEPVDGR